jgi:hypothetical protein
METFVCPIIFLVIGALLFTQWRKAQAAQKRTDALLWGAASVLVSALGLIGLLGALVR